MNLANQQDIETVKDCVSLAEEGLCQAIPEIKFKNAKIKTSSWLSIEDSEKEKDEIFRKFGNPNFAIEEEAFNATEIEYRPSGTLKNKNDGWVVNFQLEKSQISGSDLFFIFDIEYFDGGKYNRLEDRADHASSTCFKILADFGLEPVNGFGKD